MYKKNIGLYTFLLIIATLILGVAYAKTVEFDMYIEGNALIIPNESVEIISVTYKDGFKVDTEDSKVLVATRTMINSSVMLEKDKDAFLTLSVTIKNNTDKDLYYIETVKNDNFYTNANNAVNTQIVYELDGINKYDKVSKNGGEISFDLTFKYDVENTDDIEDVNKYLNSYLNFRFREVYSITYIGITNDGYADKLSAGEDYVITFTDNIPEKIIVTGDVSSSYIDGTLTLTDINSDIVIAEEGDVVHS